MTEDEMFGLHHRLNGHGFEQTPGNREGEGSLESCSPWGCQELDKNERLNNKINKTKSGVSSQETLVIAI